MTQAPRTSWIGVVVAAIAMAAACDAPPRMHKSIGDHSVSPVDDPTLHGRPEGSAGVGAQPHVPMTSTLDAIPPRIDLFGTWPEQAEVPFVSRPAGALTQHSFTQVGGDFDPDVSPDGQWLAFASTRHRAQPALYLKAVTGRAVTQLTNDNARDVQPAFAPDGKRIAFASDRGGSWDLWVIDIEGSRPVRLTDDEGFELHPTWSSDGTRLAYCRITPRGGAWELWVLDVDRPGTRRFIGPGLFPRWSPQGDRLAYQQARQRDSHLFSVWILEMVAGEPRPPMEIAADPDRALISPSWSSDGSRLAFASIQAGSVMPADYDTPPDRGSEIWMVDADGRNPIRLTESPSGNYSPTWSGDGRVYFTSTRTGRENIWSVRPVAASLVAVPTPPPPSAAPAPTTREPMPSMVAPPPAPTARMPDPIPTPEPPPTLPAPARPTEAIPETLSPSTQPQPASDANAGP